MSSEEAELETLLSLKSKGQYIHAYENFITWRNDKNMHSMSEEVLLAYFEEMAPKYKPSTLWTTYSLLKHGLKRKHDVKMETYQQLTAFLKKLSKGFVRKKGKAFSMEDVERFLDEAPDDKYLSTKVALIFGVAGGLGRQELCEVTTSSIENHGEVFLVHKPRTKKNLQGSFVIEGKYYNIVKKYQSLRTDKSPSNRFFQQFRDGKCRAQVIGINRFGTMPKEIAEFLNLPDASLYTGHSFRSISRRPGEVRIRERPEWWESASINDSNSSTRTQPEPPSSRPSTRQEPNQNKGTQCRFCGDFKECTPVVQKPYLMGNKVSLALNHLRVELDFSIDSLPKTVCRDCDTKLLETFEFIKQVNTAQFSLVAVSENTNAIIVHNLAHTYTSNDYEFNAQIVKAEFESDEENECKVIEDSLTLGETVYLKETHKRKKKVDSDKTQKKRKVKDKNVVKTQNTELIIDIKEEIVDLDTNDESSVDLNDTGTDMKPNDEQLAESEFVYIEGDNIVNERQVKGKIKSSDRQCND